MDDDIIRFIVATDNHLGFCERDPIRCNDSFAAFEEVLQQAKKRKVDFILLAGDLFHENKPSRQTLHHTVELLRRYCFGNSPIFIEVLNEQNELFRASLGKVNYEDPFHAVSLPIFAIHGNHDDPSRDGGNGEALAALDLLAVSNLVNYVGKVDAVDNIEITPILIRKDKTKIALYGLGAIRDERLNRMWNLKKVKFIRLTTEQGREDYFNIFLIHQNRDYGRGRKNCIHESMIPDWMDLVIWGNEHECLPQLQESLVGTYRILQPGSSVACSLSKGESTSSPKHMAYFEVKERKFRMKPVKFQQVRQFIYDEVCLKNYKELDPSNNRIEELIKEVLRKKVNEMIKEGRNYLLEQEQQKNNEHDTYDDMIQTRFTLTDPKKVLIRLKVDHEGFNAINHQRFGAQFIGEVANPAEVLLLTRKRQEVVRKTIDNISAQGELRQLLAEGAEEEIHRIRIEDLVNETLANSKYSLSILTENDMAQALDDYIIKKIPNAIQDLVIESLDRVQRMMSRDTSVTDKSSILKAAETCKTQIVAKEKEKKKKEPAADPKSLFDLGSSTANAIESAPAATKGTRGKKAVTTGRGKKAAVDLDEDEFDDAPPPPPAPAKNARGRSTRAAATKAKSFIEIDSDDDVQEVRQKGESDDEDDYKPKKMIESDEEEFSEEEVAPKPKRGRKAKVLDSDDDEDVKPTKGKAKGRATTSTASTAARGGKRTAKEDPPKRVIHEEDDVMEIDDSPPPIETPVSQKPVEAAKPTGKKTRQLPLSFSQASVSSTTSKSRFGKAKDIANQWDD